MTMTTTIKTKFAEIERNARDRDRRDQGPKRFNYAGRLAKEIMIVFRDFYGTLDDCPSSHGLFSILLNCIARAGDNAPARMQSARREFVPWMDDATYDRLAAQAMRMQRRWTPDKIAQRLAVTLADRTGLGLTLIGATDCNAEKRAKMRRDRNTEAKRNKRRAEGTGLSRPEWEALNNKSSTQPWLALGISKATYYRKGLHKSAEPEPVRQVRVQHEETLHDADGPVSPPQLMMPQLIEGNAVEVKRPPSKRPWIQPRIVTDEARGAEPVLWVQPVSVLVH